MQVVDVEVDDVELARGLGDVVEHREMVRERIVAIRIEPQAGARARPQLRARARIRRREERHLMAQSDQLLGEVRNDALRSSVELRRHAFVERGDDGDAQAARGDISRSHLRKDIARRAQVPARSLSPSALVGRTIARGA